MINFGPTIRALREKRHKTQVELAQLIKVEPTYLSAVENGKKEPSVTLVKRIAKALNMSPEVMFWNAIEFDVGLNRNDRKILRLAKEVVGHYLKGS